MSSSKIHYLSFISFFFATGNADGRLLRRNRESGTSRSESSERIMGFPSVTDWGKQLAQIDQMEEEQIRERNPEYPESRMLKREEADAAEGREVTNI